MVGTQVTERSITSLRPYARNARTHSKKQVRQIAASIERFGFTNPVLISADGEIIAGHGRVEAAKLLGWKAVPTIVLAHLRKRFLEPIGQAAGDDDAAASLQCAVPIALHGGYAERCDDERVARDRTGIVPALVAGMSWRGDRQQSRSADESQ